MSPNIPKNYSQAEIFLANKDSRRIPGIRSTIIRRLDDERIALVYHDTNVVTWHKNGNVCLNSGGHRTKTTKKRMNQGSPFSIYQKGGIWYVSVYQNSVIPTKEGYVIYKFKDEICFSKYGEIIDF